MSDRYADIIDLPHHVSKNHPPQPTEKRAAQFSPFAALTGYDDAVEETARFVDTMQTIEEEQQAELNAALGHILDRIADHPTVEVTYFEPDGKKEGGAYRTMTGRVQKIDPYRNVLLVDGTTIPFEHLYALSETERKTEV